MQIEYEIKFLEIDPDYIRQKIQSIWWICTIPLRRMQRYVFAHPNKKNAYIRIRQEWNKITTSYKEHDENKAIDSVKEIEVTIDNAEALRRIYIECGLREKAIQETYRETWEYENIVITIDRRPWLKPFIEIEWPNQISVEKIVEKMGLHIKDGLWWTVSDIYNQELWIPHEIINETAIITFDNPPQKRIK